MCWLTDSFAAPRLLSHQKRQALGSLSGTHSCGTRPWPGDHGLSWAHTQRVDSQQTHPLLTWPAARPPAAPGRIGSQEREHWAVGPRAREGLVVAALSGLSSPGPAVWPKEATAHPVAQHWTSGRDPAVPRTPESLALWVQPPHLGPSLPRAGELHGSLQREHADSETPLLDPGSQLPSPSPRGPGQSPSVTSWGDGTKRDESQGSLCLPTRRGPSSLASALFEVQVPEVDPVLAQPTCRGLAGAGLRGSLGSVDC